MKPYKKWKDGRSVDLGGTASGASHLRMHVLSFIYTKKINYYVQMNYIVETDHSKI